MKRNRGIRTLLLGTVLLLGAVLPVHYAAAQFSLPEILTAGSTYTVGVKSDGTVVAIGSNIWGQCDVSGFVGIQQASAETYHTVMLTSFGTAAAVGHNSYGQCDVWGWSDLQQVSAGGFHTVGLKSDGTVVAVGDNGSGQCNIGGWSAIQQISAGWLHTVGLRSDGTVVAVGLGFSGQCNVGGWSDIVQVSAGEFHTIGLRSDGTVVAVGQNNYGQCDVSSWTGIVQVSTFDEHTIGLKADGTVVAVGRNHAGQCDVSGWSSVVQISAGGTHSVGLKSDGTVIAAGSNAAGQCDVSDWNLSGGSPLQADFSADKTEGSVPLDIHFTDKSAWGAPPFSFYWDFDRDGIWDSFEQNPTFTFNTAGTYTILHSVVDADGNRADEMKFDYITAYGSPPPPPPPPPPGVCLQVDGEGLADGAPVPGWDLVFGGPPAIATVTATSNAAGIHSGSRGVRVNGDYEAGKELDTIAKGIVTVDYWHYPRPGSSTNSMLRVCGGDYTGPIGVGVWTYLTIHKNDQDLWWIQDAQGSHPPVASYSGKYTHIVITIDTNTGLFALNIDGNLVYQGTVENADKIGTSGIRYLSVHSGRGGAGTNSYFDDILITATAGGSPSWPQGYALIVAAYGSGSLPWPENDIFDHCANNVYRVLRNVGFEDSHIYYLSNRNYDVDGDGVYDVDGDATEANFKTALGTIKNQIGQAPLILYFIGHGLKDFFIFDDRDDNEALDVTELDNLLRDSSFQRMTNPMLIQINSCFAGTFITSTSESPGSISAQGRIITTGARDWSYANILPLCVPLFSDTFWGCINSGDDVKHAFVEAGQTALGFGRWIDDNGDATAHSYSWLGDDGDLAGSTVIGEPGAEKLELVPTRYYWKHSPGELRVYDSQGRMTGTFGGQTKTEIPGSMYDEDEGLVVLLPPFDTYYCEVVGTGVGEYGLGMGMIAGNESLSFRAEDIPLELDSVHRYSIDWQALWQGEDGVAVEVDSDGDGIVDYALTSGNELTAVETVTGAGTAWFSPSAGNITGLSTVPEGSLPPAAQATKPINFPDGLFSFNITGLSPGDTVAVTITLPPGSAPTQYWKYHASEGGWIQIPMTVMGPPNVIRITLVDGGLGDDDLTANGVIVDQGGPGGGAVGWEIYPVSKVRALLPWVALLSAIVAGAGVLALRRRRA